MDHSEFLEVGTDVVAAEIDGLDAGVGFEAHEELVEAIGGDAVTRDVEGSELHVLLSVEGTQVDH